MTLRRLKEYARAEGVSAKLGVALKSAADPSCKNGVPEMVEYYKKVPRNSARPHVDFVPGGSVTVAFWLGNHYIPPISDFCNI